MGEKRARRVRQTVRWRDGEERDRRLALIGHSSCYSTASCRSIGSYPAALSFHLFGAPISSRCCCCSRFFPYNNFLCHSALKNSSYSSTSRHGSSQFHPLRGNSSHRTFSSICFRQVQLFPQTSKNNKELHCKCIHLKELCFSSKKIRA